MNQLVNNSKENRSEKGHLATLTRKAVFFALRQFDSNNLLGVFCLTAKVTWYLKLFLSLLLNGKVILGLPYTPIPVSKSIQKGS